MADNEYRTEALQRAMQPEAVSYKYDRKNIQTLLQNPWIMAAAVSVIVFVLLLITQPPFVMSKPKHSLGDSSLSTSKLIFWSLFAGGLTIAAPFVMSKINLKKNKIEAGKENK